MKIYLDTVLKAKFNGRLFNVKINKGQFISSNEKIADIFSIDDLEVEFVVPSKSLFRCKKFNRQVN